MPQYAFSIYILGAYVGEFPQDISICTGKVETIRTALQTYLERRSSTIAMCEAHIQGRKDAEGKKKPPKTSLSENRTFKCQVVKFWESICWEKCTSGLLNSEENEMK